MQYTNYAMKNNVFGTLSAPISSLATTIQLNTGQGQRFTADMLATLESMEGNKVTKREIVKITNVTGDTLTVIRKFAPCPSSDDANTQGQVSYSFSADDTISVYITKEHFDKIDGSINDLYDNGTNKLRTEVISGLQIKVNPGTVLVGSAYYDFAGDTITLTDSATNYVEISENGVLVANTTGRNDKNAKIAVVITSGWAVTGITDWRLGTVGWEMSKVNIHDLTEKEIVNPEDEFIVSDSENVRNNKKVKASNLLGYETWIFAENVNKWDIVWKKYYDSKNVNDSVNLGQKFSKIAAKIFGSWVSTNNIKLQLAKVNNWQNINVRIETDNNWTPSWILINNNAEIVISASELSTTLTENNYIFNDNINLTKLNTYWLVIEVPTTDDNNYCIVWTDNTQMIKNYVYYNWERTTTIYGSDTTAKVNVTGGWASQWYKNPLEWTVIFNTSIFLTSISCPGNRTTDVKIEHNWETLYNWASENINLILTQGETYIITTTHQYWMQYYSWYWYNSSICTSISIDWWPRDSDTIYFNYNLLTTFDKQVKLTSNFVAPYVVKVNTNNINTFSDIIGVAIADKNEWEMWNIAVDGGIITNDNRDLIIWQDYFFVNNTMIDTPTTNTNIVYLWKAVNNTTIKIDIKKALYNLSSNIAPFTWLNSGVPVYKGETVTGSLIAWF